LSQLLIQQYLNDLAKLRKVAGTNRETVVREAFKDLLKTWGRSLDLTFITEHTFETKAKERRSVDGCDPKILDPGRTDAVAGTLADLRHDRGVILLARIVVVLLADSAGLVASSATPLTRRRIGESLGVRAG
jgi:hypothetical protein